MELTEVILIAGYANKERKAEAISKASVTLDLLKYFLQTAFELKAIDNKKLAALSVQLGEVGKMLGGWKKYSGQ
jgi:hypothetical protein